MKALYQRLRTPSASEAWHEVAQLCEYVKGWARAIDMDSSVSVFEDSESRTQVVISFRIGAQICSVIRAQAFRFGEKETSSHVVKVV